jgi:hypothetical protein
VKTFQTGTLAGAGSFRCETCTFHVALHALDEIPQCPNCGDSKFSRASMFDVPDTLAASGLHGEQDPDWLPSIRVELEQGQFLAFQDADQVSVVALTREWSRIGRSLAADICLDDPTVSRRHALVCLQDGRARLLDDRSLNGIFLNGERVEWADLNDGDELIIGRYRLFFLDSSAAGSLVEQPPATKADPQTPVPGDRLLAVS